MPTLRTGLDRTAAIVILVFFNANNSACLTKPSIGPKFIQNVSIGRRTVAEKRRKRSPHRVAITVAPPCGQVIKQTRVVF